MSTAAGVQAGKRQTIWYFVLLALASLIWSGQGIAVKVLDPHLGPIAITFLPFYVTTLLFVPLLLRLRRQNPGPPPPSARDWVSFIIAGVGGPGARPIGNDLGNQQVAGVERRHPESAHSRNQRGLGFLHVEGTTHTVAHGVAGDRAWWALCFFRWEIFARHLSAR